MPAYICDTEGMPPPVSAPKTMPFEDTGLYMFFNYLKSNALDEWGRDCESFHTRWFMDSTRRSLETLYFSHAGLLKGWYRSGNEVGVFVAEVLYILCTRLCITEQSVREGWAERDECWATMCPNRIHDKTKTKPCRGCRVSGGGSSVAKYCSKECQKA